MYKLLKDLNSPKATGPNDIPARLLETAIISVLYLRMAHQIETSIDKWNIPTPALDWRSKLVTPVFMKGNISEPGNYRPNSLTSMDCMIREYVIHNCRVPHEMPFWMPHIYYLLEWIMLLFIIVLKALSREFRAGVLGMTFMQMTLSLLQTPWKNVSVDCWLGKRVWRGREWEWTRGRPKLWSVVQALAYYRVQVICRTGVGSNSIYCNGCKH